MYCQKCGSEVNDTALRCNVCGMKINMLCPDCNTLNRFGSQTCINCGFELIKSCPKCGASNIYSAEKCRKCLYVFENLQENKTFEAAAVLSNVIESVHKKNQQLSDNYEKTTDKNEKNQESLNNRLSAVIDNKTDKAVLDINVVQETIALVSDEKEQEVTEDNECKNEAGDIFEIVEEEPDFKLSQDIEQFEIEEDTAVYDDSITDSAELAEKESPSSLPLTLGEDENEISTPDISTENIIEDDEPEIITQEEVNEQTLLEGNDTSADTNNDISEKTNSDDLNIADAADIDTTELNIKYYSQIQAKQKIVNTILNSKSRHIISVNGEEGSGKSIVLQYIMKELQSENVVSLFGECTPSTQLSNFGFMQDVFLRFFSLPAFTANIDMFLKNNKKTFENIFNLMSQDEICDFINFLYPSKTAEYENINLQKEKTFCILEKAIKSIMSKNRVVIVSDNFELIDGASYEFLVNIIEKGYLDNGIKLLIAYKDRKVAQSYFYNNNLPETSFENIYLDKLSDEQIETFLGNFLNGNLEVIPPDMLKAIKSNCMTNTSYIEQIMAYLYDNGYLSIENENVKYSNPNDDINIIPQNISSVIKKRLKQSINITPVLRNALFSAAIIGYKFDVQILSETLNLPDEQVNAILSQLAKLLFIVPVNQYTFAFKNLSLWGYVFEEAKNDDLFRENNKKVYEVLNSYTISNYALKAITCQNISSNKQLFDDWNVNSNLAAYIGDTNLFVISQKQCLKILSENNFDNAQVLYNEICERIGKLLYKSNPAEAVTYLSNVVANAKKNNDIVKIVDLCGYIVNSCYAIGSYFGVIEAVNLVSTLVQTEASPLEIALIKSRKLQALFYIGNCEEVINLACTEIIAVLEESLSKPKEENDDSKTLIYESWLETNLILANAYAMQGNEKCIEVVDNVLEIMRINKIESRYYETKAALVKAFSYSVIGHINHSHELLNEVTKAYKNDFINPEFLSRWNMTYVINQILTDNFTGLKEELFSLATFANNTNDQFSKNIIKTILGFIIQKDGNLAKALEIYNEQITYFAKEKIAIGALLCWYLIAQITLTSEGADKSLDIALKALEVAQNPKINNYNFIIYLQKFIAEIYIIKGDLDATKMYLEKALLVAKQFGLKYAQVEIYIAFAKYIEEVISVKVVNKSQTAQKALEVYDYALSIAVELDIPTLTAKVNKSKSAFKTYCQLNSIEL